MSADPFSVLEIPPTLDSGQVKRAYFRLLAKHPPHQDPEGFRRLRQAYEELTRPGGQAVAYLRAPVDVAAELMAYEERYGAALAQAQAAWQGEQDRQRATERLVEAVGRLTYAEVLGSPLKPPS